MKLILLENNKAIKPVTTSCIKQRKIAIDTQFEMGVSFKG